MSIKAISPSSGIGQVSLPWIPLDEHEHAAICQVDESRFKVMILEK